MTTPIRKIPISDFLDHSKAPQLDERKAVLQKINLNGGTTPKPGRPFMMTKMGDIQKTPRMMTTNQYVRRQNIDNSMHQPQSRDVPLIKNNQANQQASIRNRPALSGFNGKNKSTPQTHRQQQNEFKIEQAKTILKTTDELIDQIQHLIKISQDPERSNLKLELLKLFDTKKKLLHFIEQIYKSENLKNKEQWLVQDRHRLECEMGYTDSCKKMKEYENEHIMSNMYNEQPQLNFPMTDSRQLLEPIRLFMDFNMRTQAPVNREEQAQEDIFNPFVGQVDDKQSLNQKIPINDKGWQFLAQGIG